MSAEIPLVSASKAICLREFYCSFHFHKPGPGSTGQFISSMHMIFLRKEWTWFFFLFFLRNLRSTCRFSKAFRPHSSTLGAIKKREKDLLQVFFLRISRDSWIRWLFSLFLWWLSNAWGIYAKIFFVQCHQFLFFLHAISKEKTFLTDDNRMVLKRMHLKRWFGW